MACLYDDCFLLPPTRALVTESPNNIDKPLCMYPNMEVCSSNMYSNPGKTLLDTVPCTFSDCAPTPQPTGSWKLSLCLIIAQKIDNVSEVSQPFHTLISLKNAAPYRRAIQLQDQRLLANAAATAAGSLFDKFEYVL